jgi:hypothetical protein
LNWLLLLLACGGSVPPEKVVIGNVEKVELTPYAELFGDTPSLPKPVASLRFGMDEGAARAIVEAAREQRMPLDAAQVGHVLVLGGALAGYDGGAFAVHIDGSVVSALDLSIPLDSALATLTDAWGEPKDETTKGGPVKRWTGTDLNADLDLTPNEEGTAILMYRPLAKP